MALSMQEKEKTEIFHRILDYLGVKLELRSITGDAPKQDDASSNSFYFYSKTTNTPLFEKIKYHDDTNNWKLTSESDAAKFLLSNLVEFVNISFTEDRSCQVFMGKIKNPFFGCSNLEAAALKLDLLTSTSDTV